MANFNEQTLYEEIIKIWGPHGAHAEVYKAVCDKAGLALIEPMTGVLTNESTEDMVRRIYAKCDRSKLQTIKEVRLEMSIGLIEAKRLVESIIT